MSDVPGKSTVEFPNELDIVITRRFSAPIDLVFDVFTKPAHVRRTFATNGEAFTVCEIDLRVGGAYHFVLVTSEGVECSFRGTYSEIDTPRKTVASWAFNGWPDTEAVETVELAEVGGGTQVSWKLSFHDIAGRSRMTGTEGPESNFESIDRYLQSLLAPQ